MENLIYSLEIGRDAGLLREYVARTYGDVFIPGNFTDSRIYNRAMGFARKLSRMTKIALPEVIADLAADAEILDAEAA
jgi:hypothetical protein